MSNPSTMLDAITPAVNRGLSAVSVAAIVIVGVSFMSRRRGADATMFQYISRERGTLSLLFFLYVGICTTYVEISREFDDIGIDKQSAIIATVVGAGVGLGLGLGFLVGGPDSSAPVKFTAETREQKVLGEYALRGIGWAIFGASVSIPLTT